METTPISAESVPAPGKKTVYPDRFAPLVDGRTKRKLGDWFGLTNFGVNLTHLSPGAVSALFHHHSTQDEFVYILVGTPTLLLGEREVKLSPGECVGFKAGSGVAHQLVNQSSETVAYIEVGDRSSGDEVDYPKDDIRASFTSAGTWDFAHKDGSPY